MHTETSDSVQRRRKLSRAIQTSGTKLRFFELRLSPRIGLQTRKPTEAQPESRAGHRVVRILQYIGLGGNDRRMLQRVWNEFAVRP